MNDDKRILPFAKPTKRVRLEPLGPEDRRAVFDKLLNELIMAEANPAIVGYTLVFLCDCGRRISYYTAQQQALVQLAYQTRRQAAELTRASGEEWAP